jgi:hypothetical protein
MRWWIAILSFLWVSPVGAQVDLWTDERRAAYCYGAAVENDTTGRHEQLYDYLEGRGLGFYGHRPIHARQLSDEIGRVGARDFQICKISPMGTACMEVASCQ